jgi:hypothetical protein
MRVVGSLTTLPKRLNVMSETLLSILNQSFPLEVLYFNVPYETKKGEPYIFDDKISQIISDHSNVKLNRCNDFGSITKILPTLEFETDPNTIIITFDDDVIYSPNLVELLVNGVKKYEDACVGTGGWIVGSWPFLYESVHDVEKQVDWIEGKTAVAYRRKFLPQNPADLLVHPFPKHLSQHDDHIITYHIAKLGAKRVVVDGRTKLEERMNVRSIDSISGNPFKYLNQVRQIIQIMHREEIYVQSSTCHKTYGFKVMLVVIFIVLMVSLIIWSKRKH